MRLFRVLCFSTLFGIIGGIFIRMDAFACTEIRNSIPTAGVMNEIRKTLPKSARPILMLAYVTGYSGSSNTPPVSDAISKAPFHANKGDGRLTNPGTAAVNPLRGRFIIPYGARLYIPRNRLAKSRGLLRQMRGRAESANPN
jgi:hypothetical protein